MSSEIGGGQPHVPLQKKREIRDRIRHSYQKLLGFFTYDGFARYIDIPRTTITAWLGNPPRVPSTAHILAFAERANINPTWLLLGEGPELRGMSYPEAEMATALEQTVRAHLTAKGLEERELEEFLDEWRTEMPLLGMFLLLCDVRYHDWLKKKVDRVERQRLEKDREVIEYLFDLLNQADQAASQAARAGHPLAGISVPGEPIRDAARAINRVLNPAPVLGPIGPILVKKKARS